MNVLSASEAPYYLILLLKDIALTPIYWLTVVQAVMLRKEKNEQHRQHSAECCLFLFCETSTQKIPNFQKNTTFPQKIAELLAISIEVWYTVSVGLCPNQQHM